MTQCLTQTKLPVRNCDQNNQGFSTTIISHKYRYIYSYVPKAACTTIRCLLAKKEGLPWYPNWTEKDGKVLMTPFEKIQKSDIFDYWDYTYFAFVRNPWSRLVSCYFDKVVSVRTMPNSRFVCDGIYHMFKKRYPAVRFDKMDFPDFAEFVISVDDSQSDGHFRSQHTFLVLNRLDFLGKVESLNTDLEKLFGDVSAEQLQAHGKTEHRRYTDYYDETLKAKVGSRYAKDIEIFGYTFGE